jgi:hypothetical protein
LVYAVHRESGLIIVGWGQRTKPAVMKSFMSSSANDKCLSQSLKVSSTNGKSTIGRVSCFDLLNARIKLPRLDPTTARVVGSPLFPSANPTPSLQAGSFGNALLVRSRPVPQVSKKANISERHRRRVCRNGSLSRDDYRLFGLFLIPSPTGTKCRIHGRLQLKLCTHVRRTLTDRQM